VREERTGTGHRRRSDRLHGRDRPRL